MNKLTVTLFLISFSISAFSVYRTFVDVYEKSKRLTNLGNEVSSLEEENERLHKELSYKSSDEFMEKEAREKLFMGLPGEKIIIVPKNFFKTVKLKNLKGKVLGESVKLPVWVQWYRRLFLE